ncbi:MAG: Rossmann-like and DUF2520 domain-containing protein [Bryobacteraceae bacterium]
MTDPIGIAGAGRVAQAMGRLLLERGFAVVCVAGRNPARTVAAAAFIGSGIRAVSYGEIPGRARRILIAVPDAAIVEVSNTLASTGMRGTIALHTCGTKGPDALQSLKDQGVSCGTLHPLQTIASPEQGVRDLPGCAFAVDGDSRAVAWAEEIARRLGGEVLRIAPEMRPVYHAAAVMASNYLVGLIAAAQHLMKMAGVAEEKCLPALQPLLRATMENVLLQGPVGALTGPIERGDCETIAAHLQALDSAPAEIRGLYRAAGLEVLALAVDRGLAAGPAASISQQLRGN